MSETKRVVGAASGALGLGAFAAMFATCCVAPWAVSLLGVSGAIALARLAVLQPYLLIAAGILLGAAFFWVYVRHRRVRTGHVQPRADAGCARSFGSPQ